MEENKTVVAKKHSIVTCERKDIIIEGVIKLDSFDKSEFLLETTKGYLHVKGHNLTLGNMDMEKGNLTIEGNIDAIIYLNGNNSNKEKEGFWKKLFK